MPILAPLFFIIFIVLPIVLQIYLSKKENKWLGRIIPIVQFVFSVVIVISNVLFSVVVDVGVDTTITGDLGTSVTMAGIELFVGAIILFILTNIPTVISLLIYFANRKGIEKKKQLDKLNIQDLD